MIKKKKKKTLALNSLFGRGGGLVYHERGVGMIYLLTTERQQRTIIQQFTVSVPLIENTKRGIHFHRSLQLSFCIISPVLYTFVTRRNARQL